MRLRADYIGSPEERQMTRMSRRSGPVGRNRAIVVVGSINMDLVCRTPRLPLPGETVLGLDFRAIPGGKGANQAVAAARLGAEVHLIGRVGDDDFGRRLIADLAREGVRTERVKTTRGIPTGCALILVDERGENSIAVAPGANSRLSPRDLDAARGLIARAAVAVMQLEVPLETVERAIGLCERFEVPTILDPAPAPPRGLPRALYRVDLLTPNESEARMLLGRGAPPRSSPLETARRLLARGPRTLVLKLGARGAVSLDRAGVRHRSEGFRVQVVDTTAAGDAFTGGLSVATAEGLPLAEALRFANGAGALACTRLGAQPSLPTRAQVERLLRALSSEKLSGEKGGRRGPKSRTSPQAGRPFRERSPRT
jgi:ribokinase